MTSGQSTTSKDHPPVTSTRPSPTVFFRNEIHPLRSNLSNLLSPTLKNQRFMNWKSTLSLALPVLFASGPLVAQKTATTDSAEPPAARPIVALLVEAQSPKLPDTAGAELSDQLAARLAAAGYDVMTPDDVLEAIQPPLDPKEDLDRALRENTSALQLARNIGADFLLVTSMLSYETESKNYTGYGVENRNETYRMRVSSRLVKTSDGSALSGDSVTVAKTFRQDANLTTRSDGIASGLIDDASAVIATYWRDQLATGKISDPGQPAQLANVTIRVSVRDISVPVVVRTSGGEAVTTGEAAPAQALGVSVEADGVVVGSAPGTIQLRPGIHRLKLTREGFRDWNRQVNVIDGQVLEVAMEFDEAGLKRWMETSAFLESLRTERVLTDAEVTRIEGEAQRLRQSGILYEIRVDTDEAITIRNENKTLQGNIEN